MKIKELTPTLATTVRQVLDGKIHITQLSATEATKLTLLGCLGLDNKGKIELTPKAEKLLTKANKQAREHRLAVSVELKMTELLTEPGQLIKHRAVWEAMGRDDYTRNEVLIALRTLRSAGFLKNIKKSNNNFQVFWTLASDSAEPADFQVNG